MTDETVEESVNDVITLELTQEEQDTAVFHYVIHHLCGASIEQFNDVLDDTKDLKEALYHAILNETINNALIQQINILKEQGKLDGEV